MMGIRNILIADDEPPARARLRRLLTGQLVGVTIREAETGQQVLDLLHEAPVDLLFLDVLMPELDGLSALAAMDTPPVVILVTAHDRFAVAAFEAGAADYLLKPFTLPRLRQALERASERLDNRGSSSVLASLESLRQSQQQLATQVAAMSRGNTEHVVYRRGGTRFVLPATDIELLQSARNYTRIQTVKGEEAVIREALGSLGQRLDPRHFVRVHRNCILNLRCVVRVEPWFAGDLMVIMKSGTQVKLSRTHKAAFFQSLSPGTLPADDGEAEASDDDPIIG